MTRGHHAAPTAGLHKRRKKRMRKSPVFFGPGGIPPANHEDVFDVSSMRPSSSSLYSSPRPWAWSSAISPREKRRDWTL